MDMTTEVFDLLEAAWAIIANAYGGDWELAENPDWKPAAELWRDEYHKLLPVDQDDIAERSVEDTPNG